MKKNLLFTIILFAAVAMQSCKDDTTEETQFTQGTDRIEAAVEGGIYRIAYSLANPVEGAMLSAYSPAEWIGDFDFSQKEVISFKVLPNNTEEVRTTTVEIRYGALGFDVPVTQAALENPDRYDVNTISTDCEGIYFGDAYFGNDLVYTHYLRIGDPLTDNGGLSSEGTYYILRLNAPLEAYPAAGDYTTTPTADKYTEYTILTGESSNVTYQGRTNYIKDGTMKITHSDDGYEIEITLTTTNSATFHTVYKGNYPIIDKSIEWLSDNFDTTMTRAFSWYLADMQYENSNLNITLYEHIDDAGWIVVPSSVLILVGHAEFDKNGELIPGTFTINSDTEAENRFAPGECVNFLNAPFPTGSHLAYYFDEENPQTARIGLIDAGTVTIEKNGTEYSLSYDLTTDRGTKVTGGYTGPIKVQDAPKEEIKHDWDLPEDYALKFESDNLKTQAFSDKYTVKGSLVWQVQLQQYDANWNFDSDQITIRIVGNLEDKEGPVPGSYRVSAGNEEGTVMAGEYFGTFGTGTFFQHYETGTIVSAAAAVDGELQLTKNDDGTYTIEFDFIDPQSSPKHFTGSWTGTMDVW